jgi:uncharacterized protein (TIGR03437 family)
VPLLYVSGKQVNLQVPNSVSGRREAQIEIYHRGTRRAQATVPVVESAPGLFPQVVLLDGSINSAQNPVARGGIVTLFATGTGRLAPDLVEVQMGSLAAQVLWAGPAPGLPGLMQINLRLPSGFFAPGSHSISFKIGTFSAPPGAFVYLQ